MAFLSGLNEIRSIKWGKKHLWDVKFKDAPAPFNTWFPASNLEENIYTINSKDFTVANTTFHIPESTSSFDIKLTFYDDVENTLLEWLRYWVNTEILNDGRAVSAVSDCVKLLEVAKLDNQKKIINTTGYWVYPEGDLYEDRSSDSAPQAYSVNFRIVASTPSQDSKLNKYWAKKRELERRFQSLQAKFDPSNYNLQDLEGVYNDIKNINPKNFKL